MHLSLLGLKLADYNQHTCPIFTKVMDISLFKIFISSGAYKLNNLTYVK